MSIIIGETLGGAKLIKFIRNLGGTKLIKSIRNLGGTKLIKFIDELHQIIQLVTPYHYRSSKTL